MKKGAYIFLFLSFLFGIAVFSVALFSANKNLKEKIVSVAKADDDEDEEDDEEYDEDGEEEYKEDDAADSKKKSQEYETVTQTVVVEPERVITENVISTLTVLDSDHDGIADGIDPHPDIPEVFVVQDADGNGIVDKFEYAGQY